MDEVVEGFMIEAWLFYGLFVFLNTVLPITLSDKHSVVSPHTACVSPSCRASEKGQEFGVQ